MSNTDKELKIKNALRKYTNIKYYIDVLTSEIESFKHNKLCIDNLKNLEISFNPIGKTNKISNPVLQSIINLSQDLEGLISYNQKKINELVNIKVNIDEALDNLKFSERQIIEMRYFDNRKWEDINNELHIDRRWAMKLHKNAMDTIFEFL